MVTMTPAGLQLKWLGAATAGLAKLEEGTQSKLEVVARADAGDGPVLCGSADDSLSA